MTPFFSGVIIDLQRLGMKKKVTHELNHAWVFGCGYHDIIMSLLRESCSFFYVFYEKK